MKFSRWWLVLIVFSFILTFFGCGFPKKVIKKEFLQSVETENVVIWSTYEHSSKLETYDFASNESIAVFSSDEVIKNVLLRDDNIYILYEKYILKTDYHFKEKTNIEYPVGGTFQGIDLWPVYELNTKEVSNYSLYFAKNDRCIYYNGEKKIIIKNFTSVESLYDFTVMNRPTVLVIGEDGIKKIGACYYLDTGECLCEFDLENHEMVSFLGNSIVFYDNSNKVLLLYNSDYLYQGPEVVFSDINIENKKYVISSDTRYLLTFTNNGNDAVAAIYDRASGITRFSKETFLNNLDEEFTPIFVSTNGLYGYIENKSGKFIKVTFWQDENSLEDVKSSAFVLSFDCDFQDTLTTYNDYFSVERMINREQTNEIVKYVLKDYQYFISEKELDFFVPCGNIVPHSSESRLYIRQKGTGLCKKIIDDSYLKHVIAGDKIYILNFELNKIYRCGLFGDNKELLFSGSPFGITNIYFYDEVCFFSYESFVYRLHYDSSKLDKLIDIGNNLFTPLSNVRIAYNDFENEKYYIYSALDNKIIEITENEYAELSNTH